jgi:hypothetical protein
MTAIAEMVTRAGTAPAAILIEVIAPSLWVAAPDS